MEEYGADSSKYLCRKELSKVQLSEERKSISYKIIHDNVTTNYGLHNINVQKFEGCPQCTEFDTGTWGSLMMLSYYEQEYK